AAATVGAGERARLSRITMKRCAPLLLVAGLGLPGPLPAQEPAIQKKLAGFDAHMEKLVKDWNLPGISVGVVAGDHLAFAKGYGYRDYGRKLPMTPRTVDPIASNTKLFTAMAVGLLVEEGKREGDKPGPQFRPRGG